VVEQVLALGVVEVQGSGQGIKDTGGGTTERPAFELGVVLHTHASEGGDLAAAKAGNAALPKLRHASLLRGDPGPSRGQELTDHNAVVHGADPRTAGLSERCPLSTPIDSDFPGIGGGDAYWPACRPCRS
jgi:hypothetical protein